MCETPLRSPWTVGFVIALMQALFQISLHTTPMQALFREFLHNPTQPSFKLTHSSEVIIWISWTFNWWLSTVTYLTSQTSKIGNRFLRSLVITKEHLTMFHSAQQISNTLFSKTSLLEGVSCNLLTTFLSGRVVHNAYVTSCNCSVIGGYVQCPWNHLVRGITCKPCPVPFQKEC